MKLLHPLFALSELNHPYLGLIFLVGVIVAILYFNPPRHRYRRSRFGELPLGWWPLILAIGLMVVLGLLFGAGVAARML